MNVAGMPAGGFWAHNRAMRRQEIEIHTADGVMDCHLVQPEGPGRWRPVIFYMDGIGVRPALTDMTSRLASEGYLVLLPNLFYRSGAFAPFDPAKVWTDDVERARLIALVQAVTLAGAMRDTAALLETLGGRDDVAAEQIGCVGYCLGGSVALTAAATFPDRIAAAASIHGARLATDAPDSPHRGATKIRGRVYVGVAENDRNFAPEQRERLRGALEAGQVPFEIEVYPGVSHGFAIPDVPVYDRAASERHWERVLRLLSETIRLG
jgi:carboxymethylenebutenolidase